MEQPTYEPELSGIEENIAPLHPARTTFWPWVMGGLLIVLLVTSGYLYKQNKKLILKTEKPEPSAEVSIITTIPQPIKEIFDQVNQEFGISLVAQKENEFYALTGPVKQESWKIPLDTVLTDKSQMTILRNALEEVLKEDPEYYEFVKTLDTYRKTIAKKGSFILSTDNAFLRLLEKGP